MTGRERRDPYVVLAVPRQASAEEIARAYRRAARTSHPDSVGGSPERFRAVSDAYDELRDPQRRAAYDRSHPVARSRTVDLRRVGSPLLGSQHIVLGRRAPSAAAHGASDEMFRIALSLLRARW